ncbi:MAG TPA: hypothetical protein ENG35_00030 [Desulfobacteraceae bacterium]|nr:hypothetical protein [Desulfobacteraceae bacterium]
MSIQPEGEELRKAIRWVGEERKFNSSISPKDLVEKACLKFDLSPKNAEFLARFLYENDRL